jgi:hypothetical protein
MTSILAAVNRMRQDALGLYRAVVGINQSNRTAAQAQTFHVCHMFLYNYFVQIRPKFCESGGRTIAWSHFSDPTVQWVLMDDQKGQFLVTKDGRPARLVSGSSPPRWEVPPDKDASTRAMTLFLTRHGVKSMAAPGHPGCGEPCLCGGHASKHITGEACDLSNLEQLGQSIRTVASFADNTEAVDSFLHGYGLWRPLAHLPGKARELWHVEAIPLHHAHHALKHVKHHATNHKGGC